MSNEVTEEGKGKAREEVLPELTPEVFHCEMRSFGTLGQQEEWRAMAHKVHGYHLVSRGLLSITHARES